MTYNMSETINHTFNTVWMASYYPDNVPLWAGPLASMPKNYYFKTKEELDEFLNKNDKIRFSFRVKSTLAIYHEGYYYPLPEKIQFTT